VVNPNIAGLTPYQPGKPIDEVTRELGLTDVVKLASNENPRGPGPAVVDAIAGACDNLSLYPDGSAFHLKQALARHLAVTSDQLTIGNGSNDVLDLAARFALTPGAEAIVAEHAFVVYRLATAAAGGTLVEVAAKDFGADMSAMLAAITDATALIFLANPNNPTGTWVGSAELEAFLEAVPNHVWVVLDEAYLEYVGAADHPNYPNGVALLSRFPNLIVTRTFSKIYGLASLRIGYGISAPKAADLMNRARQPFNVNSLALAAAQAALDDHEFVAESGRLNKSGMANVTAGLAAMGLPYIVSVGNFVSFDVGCSGLDAHQSLLREGVIVRPIAEYGLPQHLRVTIGLPEQNAWFLAALERVLPGLRREV
jgi:histidinol-phosphate aminotransferase